MVEQKKTGIYIHIPFCVSKCGYCAFNSVPLNEELVKQYFELLNFEINLLGQKYNDYIVDTIFIGGGTPTAVEQFYLESVIENIYKVFCVDNFAEISIESNPGTLNYEKLSVYRKIGINRISIGLQAFQERHLKSLGRIHSFRQFEENFYLARETGFDNINVDLMFGLPNQTIGDWIESVDKVASLKPEHISCYSLTVEEGTPYEESVEEGIIILPTEEDDRDMYKQAKERLRELGYIQYEISNFSKPNKECRHNIKYWMLGNYLGIGVSAHSFIENSRYNNVESIKEYISVIKNGNLPIENRHEIGFDESMSEFMILGLRMNKGVSSKRFSEYYGKGLMDVFGSSIEMLISKGLMKNDGEFYKLTYEGINISNKVLSEFI